MKRALTAALLILALDLAAPAQNRSFISGTSTPSSSATAAQRSVPAPVTSETPARTFIRVRPSFGNNNFPPQCAGTGSLIPSAMGCTDPRFTGGTVHLWPRFSDSVPIYVPYAYPVVVDAQPVSEVQEPDPPAPTIFEHRAMVAPMRPWSPERSSTQPVEQSGAAQAEQIPTVLIFRDGHRAEVLNYAIVGQTLYDLGTFVAHKIPLSNLNLPATIKANEERGVDFSVPASVKLD